MKLIFSLALSTFIVLHGVAKDGNNASPLSVYSAEWNDAKYQVCNTAEHSGFLSANEKQIIYILNLARMNPKLFCKTVVLKANRVSSFIDTSSTAYYKSLVTLMSGLEPLHILTPDSLCYVSAKCHAITSGKKGYVGHVRQSAECKRKLHFMGECCQYGMSDPLEIVLSLLVDQDVESLGHRKICLGNYTKMSPFCAPHKTYRIIAVLDFY